MAEEKARLEAEAKRKAEEEAAQRNAAANNSPRPNIRLARTTVGEGEAEQTLYADPPTVEGEVYPSQGKPIMLPRLEDQKAGFYHPDAARILALYPDRYVPIVEKGGK